MKNPAPSFQFYPADFISDLNVQAMTMEERGVYTTALCHCWIEDGLKCGSRVVEGWFKQFPSVAACFVQVDGKYRNPRLDKERQKQLEWREKSADGGRKSARRKRLKPPLKGGRRVVEPPLNQKGTLSSSSSKEDSRESSIKADNTGQLFEEFWTAYPKEGRFHKKACLARFASLVKAGHLDDLRDGLRGYVDHLKDERLNKNFEKQPMHLMTFLNKERYLTYKGFEYEPRL